MKVLAIVICIAFTTVLGACSYKEETKTTPAPSASAPASTTKSTTYSVF